MSLKQFFESSVDMLCIANFDGYFVDVNPAFITLLGYTKEEILSRKINDFVYKHDKKSTQDIREGIYKNERLLNFKNRYVTKSGEIVWLSWSAVPVEDDNMVYAIAKDITQEMRLKDEHVAEFTKLKSVNEDLVRLNYTTSHDLRAPVNNLISLFDLLDFNTINDEDTTQILRYMEISAKGVKESLENYLDLIDNAGKNSNNLSEVFFNKILSKIENNLGSIVSGSNSQITSDFSKCESVYFDNAFMESILLNLITNSIKYNQPGISPKIEIQTQIKDGHKQLLYKDYGKGFDLEKNGDKIFGLNQRFDVSQEGKGVGLYLIQNQLNSLGGVISVESEPNKGATFCITFPV
ncbi:sensor histidine kinase [Maribacter sp. ACAM166]|uniref:sensor histidine kinase n=1 Tax=Maribacter sp. ACAM166 TaxID=2508996 RepID=UPI0010FE3B7E|nr:PAS domain-containing sensor histidine kinase [Maribacter sp. ACAM166]TLP82122.1 PAS domain S-box protein [Maribacter sp. ACAM166]